MSNHFIFGCGFLGIRFANKLRINGQVPWTVTRSAEKANSLRQQKIQAIVGDFKAVTFELPANLPAFDSITICVGNDGAGESGHLETYTAATLAALKLAQRSPTPSATKIMFVSTTGVYSAPESGTDQPVKIDENWPTKPTRPGSIASLHCEQILLEQNSIPASIFRLAGIYHTDRIPNLPNLKSGQPLSGDGRGWLNLIHVDDAASILFKATHQWPHHPILNIADGHPVTRQEFYDFLSQEFRTPKPIFNETGPNRGGSKQIDNTRLAQWFGSAFEFPSYKQGLERRT